MTTRTPEVIRNNQQNNFNSLVIGFGSGITLELLTNNFSPDILQHMWQPYSNALILGAIGYTLIQSLPFAKNYKEKQHVVPEFAQGLIYGLGIAYSLTH